MALVLHSLAQLRTALGSCSYVAVLQKIDPLRERSFGSPTPSKVGAYFSRPVEAGRGPVFELHAERQATRCEHFLDLIERFATEVRRLQKLGLGALDQIAEVVDVLGLEAVGRAHRELEIVDRAQQGRVDLRRRALGGRLIGALQIGEHGQLLDEHARGVADRLLRLDDAVGLDVEHELVEIGALLDTRAFHRVAHLAHRRERRVEQDAANRAAAFGLDARSRRLVAATLLDLDLHLELAARRQMCDLVLRIDELDIVIGLNIRCRARAFAALRELQQHVIAVVQLQHDPLQIEQDVDDVVQHAGDAHLGRCVARHRRQQNAPQRVAERVAVPALERLHDHLRVERRTGLDVDDARFQKNVALHKTSDVNAPAPGAPRTGRIVRPLFAYLEYNSTTRLSLMSCPNSDRSGAPLNVPVIFLTSTSTHEGKPTFSASCSASWMRSWPFARSVTPTTSPDFTMADGMLRTLPLTVIEQWPTSCRASARVDPRPIR